MPLDDGIQITVGGYPSQAHFFANRPSYHAFRTTAMCRAGAASVPGDALAPSFAWCVQPPRARVFDRRTSRKAGAVILAADEIAGTSPFPEAIQNPPPVPEGFFR